MEINSGGGYRAMLNGAGNIKAMDARESAFTSAGLLQLATYWAGLSGGNWIEGSLYYHGWPLIDKWKDMIRISDNQLLPIFGDGGLSGQARVEENYQLMVEYCDKLAANGFPVTLTEYWGLTVVYAIMNLTNQALELQMADLLKQYPMSEYAAPYPIHTTLQVLNDTSNYEISNPFEWTPHALGSYMANISAMADVSLAGTYYDKGAPVNESGSCASHYGTLWFAMATSSSAFLTCTNVTAVNEALARANETLNNSTSDTPIQGATQIIRSVHPPPSLTHNSPFRSRRSRPDHQLCREHGRGRGEGSSQVCGRAVLPRVSPHHLQRDLSNAYHRQWRPVILAGTHPQLQQGTGTHAIEFARKGMCYRTPPSRRA